MLVSHCLPAILFDLLDDFLELTVSATSSHCQVNQVVFFRYSRDTRIYRRGAKSRGMISWVLIGYYNEQACFRVAYFCDSYENKVTSNIHQITILQ